MSEAPDYSSRVAGLSFSARAAVYSVVVPLLTPVVWFLVLAGSKGYLALASTIASCLLGSSLLAAVVSLLRGHERRRFLVLAWVGMALSAVLEQHGGWLRAGLREPLRAGWTAVAAAARLERNVGRKRDVSRRSGALSPR